MNTAWAAAAGTGLWRGGGQGGRVLADPRCLGRGGLQDFPDGRQETWLRTAVRGWSARLQEVCES